MRDLWQHASLTQKAIAVVFSVDQRESKLGAVMAAEYRHAHSDFAVDAALCIDGRCTRETAAEVASNQRPHNAHKVARLVAERLKNRIEATCAKGTQVPQQRARIVPDVRAVITQSVRLIEGLRPKHWTKISYFNIVLIGHRPNEREGRWSSQEASQRLRLKHWI
jgi:hypothetical protein